MIIKLLFLKNLFSVVFFCALVPLCSNQSDLKVIIDDIYYIFKKFDIFVIRIVIVFVLPFILVNVIYLFIFLEKTLNFENIFLVDYYVICIFACIIPMYIVFNYILKCIFKCLIKYNCKVFNNIDYDAFSSVFFCSILVSILQVISNQNVITSMINITHNDPVYIGSRFYFQEYFLQKVIILINTLIIFYSERKNIIMFIIPKDKKNNKDVKKIEEK